MNPQSVWNTHMRLVYIEGTRVLYIDTLYIAQHDGQATTICALTVTFDVQFKFHRHI